MPFLPPNQQRQSTEGESINQYSKRIKYYRVCFTLAKQNFGDAKVADFDGPLLLIEQNVLSLQISVQDLFGVNVL